MAYIQATKLPDRYKIVFHNDKTGDRQRVFIDTVAFSPVKAVLDLQRSLSEAIRSNDKKAEADIKRTLVGAVEIANEAERTMFNAYSPGQDYRMWFIPYIETFDTPSKELEEGMYWEGTDRHGVARVMWRDQDGEFECAKPEEVTVSRKGDVPDVIARKPQ